MTMAHRIGSQTLGAAVFLLLCGPIARLHAADAEPKFLTANASLEFDGKSITPQTVREPWATQYRAGKRRFAVRGETLEELGDQGTKPIRSIKSGDGLDLRWLAASSDTVFCQAFTPGKENSEPEVETPLRLRRLDLKTNQWMPSLELPTSAKNPKRRDVILGVLVDVKRLAALTETWEAGENKFGDPKVISYRLSFFSAGKDKPDWSRKFPSQGTRPAPGVYLWAAAMPDYASSAIQQLQWLGNDILVCAGEKEDLLCVNVAGKVTWRIERIWEYQRGFTGPSVWQHFIGPLATEHWDMPQDDDKGDKSKKKTPDEQKRADELRTAFAKRREAFDHEYQCAIVGGPLIVRPRGKGDQDGGRIFVAVAKAPNAWNWGYLSDCIAYEISPSGTVEGMVDLPRMVNGAQFAVADDGVIWACQKDAMVKLAMDTSSGLRGFGFSPGGSDLITRIPWYRQFESPQPKAWFTSGKAGDSTAFGSRYAFRTAGGGFIADKATKVYSFPIAIVDSKTGLDRMAFLRVPFDGDFPLPKTNVATTGDTTEAMGPYLLGVTYLRTDGDRLEVVVAGEKSAAGLTFDLTSLGLGGARH